MRPARVRVDLNEVWHRIFFTQSDTEGKNAGSAGKGRGMGKGEIWGRLALALAALEHQPVRDHGDELGVGGLALGVADGEAEVFL